MKIRRNNRKKLLVIIGAGHPSGGEKHPTFSPDPPRGSPSTGSSLFFSRDMWVSGKPARIIRNTGEFFFFRIRVALSFFFFYILPTLARPVSLWEIDRRVIYKRAAVFIWRVVRGSLLVNRHRQRRIMARQKFGMKESADKYIIDARSGFMNDPFFFLSLFY